MWWVGIVEAAGNAAVVTVLVWRIRATLRTGFRSLLAFQFAALLFFASNIFYAAYFVAWERFQVDWWSGLHYDATKAAQQLSILALPLVTLNLISQLFRNPETVAKKLTANVHDK